VHTTATLVVFLLSYLLIAGTRIPGHKIDRPAGAVLGAVAMVWLGTLSPTEVYRDAVNWDTLVLLLGMMVISAYMMEAAMFRTASWLTVTRLHTPRRLLVGIVFVSGALSAFLVNDAVCLMFTPIVVAAVEDAKLPPLPYLLAVCMGSNAGSAATLTGNPQNMIVGTLSHIPYARFAAACAPAALLALCATAALLVWMFRRELPDRSLHEEHLHPPPLDRRLALKCLIALAAVVTGFFAGFNLGWTAMAGAAFLVVAEHRHVPRHVFQKVDWVLLLFFAGLFVIVHAVNKEGIAGAIHDRIGAAVGDPISWSLVTTLMSQVVSNVPFVLLAGAWMDRFKDPEFMWLVTALASTLAGNLTLVGSVANLIVFESAGRHGHVGFFQYLRYGAPVTAVTLALGLGWLFLFRSVGL
jgi:Na+/H+ antiporter NhaD/arsenite permease-like protein